MRLRIRFATIVLGLCAPLSVQGNKSVGAILSVAHVTRHGGEVRETRIYVMREHGYFLERVDRIQPSANPECKQSHGVLSDKGFQRITSISDSPEFHSLGNASSTISHQDGDFWYISIPRETRPQFLAFSTEDKKTPSVIKQLIAWFEETEKLKHLESIGLREDYQCSVFSEETADIWRR